MTFTNKEEEMETRSAVKIQKVVCGQKNTESFKSVLDSSHALMCTGNPPCALFTHKFLTVG